VLCSGRPHSARAEAKVVPYFVVKFLYSRVILLHSGLLHSCSTPYLTDVPDWRHLDLLGRPEVKQLIVWSAREMELLLKERAVDW